MSKLKAIAAVLLSLGMVMGTMTAAQAAGCGYDHTTAKKKYSEPASS